MLRIGFLSLFFLVPLGFCAAAFGPTAVWLSFIFAVFGNAMLTAGISILDVTIAVIAGTELYVTGAAIAWTELLYFSVLALGFTWIMAGNPFRVMPQVRTAYRFIVASIAGSFVLLGIVHSMGKDENILALVRSQIEAIILGTDTARQEAMMRIFSPERIIETVVLVSFRGAALVSMFFLFFINRQVAFVLARLITKKRGNTNTNGDLVRFHAPKKTIWVFSLCLPVIVVCGIFSLEYIEIAIWNLLIICAIMFLAQGGGIVLHFLTRRPMTVFMRLLSSLLFVFLVFSPGINIAALAVLVLLGIIENWIPMRTK